jgi:hypothetical protein
LTPDDYLDRDALLALGLTDPTVERLLRETPLSGHSGRPVIEAERLPELLAMLRQEGGDRL